MAYVTFVKTGERSWLQRSSRHSSGVSPEAAVGDEGTACPNDAPSDCPASAVERSTAILESMELRQLFSGGPRGIANVVDSGGDESGPVAGGTCRPFFVGGSGNDASSSSWFWLNTLLPPRLTIRSGKLSTAFVTLLVVIFDSCCLASLACQAHAAFR